MKKVVVLAGAIVVALAAVAPMASAAKSSGRVPGSFSFGTLSKWDDKAHYISGKDVWCAWRGDHVVAHVKLSNSSVETITATVKPRYYIARGSEHGSSFTAGEDIEIPGGKTVTTVIDAGSPEGTPTGARIGRCAPYLYLVD